ncbi:MAG TPA: SAF domain-containing protein [Mycobacteriales bacterium]|jgi:hypothetical protein|nr:SAF domain-containing protein [Mycobacteriales bacterium]
MSAGFPEPPSQVTVPGQGSPMPQARRHQRFRVVNARFLIGAVLVALAVAGGIQVVTAADNTTGVWSLRTALPRGTQLSQADLVSVDVKLSRSKRRYVNSDVTVLGKTLTRDVGAGELLPVDALQEPECGSLVSIPVQARHLPSTLVSGTRVDVYATTDSSNKSDNKTDRLLTAVTVQYVNRPGGGATASSGDWAVGVRVAADKAQSIVEAVRGKSIDLAIVPSRDKTDDGETPDECSSKAEKED